MKKRGTILRMARGLKILGDELHKQGNHRGARAAIGMAETLDWVLADRVLMTPLSMAYDLAISMTWDD